MKTAAPFTIIYEDARFIAVNKAPGLSVGADRWDEGRERLDRLLPPPVFTVHRIDRDTSGLVIFARDAETHRELSAAFEGRRVDKAYIAVVHGRVPWTETECGLPLVPDGDKQHRTIIDKYRGKQSLTRFRLLGGVGNYSVVEALPETGRTHQIRVHLESLGHPVVCDPLYGRTARRGGVEKGVFLSSFKKGWRGDPLTEQPLLARLGLHAAHLRLGDFPAWPPVEGGPGADSDSTTGGGPVGDGGPDGPLSLHAPLFRDMAALIRQMEKCGGVDFMTPLFPDQ
jgi:23S rRNA-/tRNA-specific pseudouridylate synthase